MNMQKPPACKISGNFVNWGPFYGTPLSENPDLAPPLYKNNFFQASQKSDVIKRNV